MILGILLLLLVAEVLLHLVSSGMRSTTKGVDSVTGGVNRLNAWLGKQLEARRANRAKKQAWFDEQIRARKEGRK